MNDVYEKIRNAVAATLALSAEEKNALGPDSGAGNVRGWDSANHINVILSIEEAFGLEFDDEHVANMPTVDAIERIVNSMKS